MPDDLSIPQTEVPGTDKSAAKAQHAQGALPAACKGIRGEVRQAVPPNVTKAIAVIVTNAWKAKNRMDKIVESGTGEVRDNLKRVHHHIEAMFDSFQEMGLEIKDHTGDAFDYGLRLKVITTQPTQGITKESVIETIKPTIYWQDQIIQDGEVVIATPT